MADSEFNPTDQTVEEVVAHLAASPQEERDRVLALENDGKKRATVLNWQPPKGAQFAKYVGAADERSISKADWKSIGIEQDALKWNQSNNFKVSLDGVHADAIEYLDKKDDGFEIVEA